MTKSLPAIMVFFSLCAIAHPQTKMLGTYLGLGEYTIHNGKKTPYSSVAVCKSLASNQNRRSCQLAYYRGGESNIYEIIWNDEAHGFVSLSAVYADREGNLIFQSGAGYCVDLQCHVSFKLGDTDVEETITVHNDSDVVERIGSIKFSDQQGRPNITFWKEKMKKISGLSFGLDD